MGSEPAVARLSISAASVPRRLSSQVATRRAMTPRIFVVGNGAAFLGAYLLEHHLAPSPEFSLRIEQGRDVGRPSLILLQARESDGRREVSVGGSVILTIRGELA
jgi:hypothetical protein